MSTPEMAATRVDEVVDGIYRISTFVPEFELGFNQFLIDDERPALLHTGDFQMYETLSAPGTPGSCSRWRIVLSSMNWRVKVAVAGISAAGIDGSKGK